MNHKELRIGNYVIDTFSTNNDVGHIASINKNGRVILNLNRGDLECNSDSDISPIPLTEEWLLKFGFIKMDGKHNFFILGINPNLKIDKNIKWVAWCNTVLNNVKFDHVHKIQNLYFSLTGEELLFKK